MIVIRFYLFLSSLFLLTLTFLFNPQPVRAEIIFQEDFESGLDRWTPLSGPWRVNEDGQYGVLVGSGSTIFTSISNAIITVPDYILEMDLIPKQGVDRNIRLRWKNNSASFEFHFNGDSGGSIYFGSKRISYPLEYNVIQKIKVIFEGQNVKFYIDDQLLFDEIYTQYQFTDFEQFGLVVGTGAAYPSEVYFDNIVIKTLDNSDNILDVAPLKQTASPWNDDLYDSANLWSSDTTFARWGCAVTSAAMVFNYHGLTKMADNSDLDPGTLNSWLKSQPDGYVRNGLTNWLALSRLSSQITGINEVDFEALEYDRILSTDHQIIKDNIDAEVPIPTILREPGHFVVARGYSDDSILINDPYHDIDDLSKYANTFENISRFTPSSTDLSYIMLVVDTNVDVKVFDENNLEVETVVIVDDPITDPSGSSETNAQPLKTVYIKNPDSGKYSIEISGTGDYLLDAYLYDKEGEVKKLSVDADTGLGTNIYKLIFDKQNSENNSALEEVTYDSLIKDIKFLYQNHEIKKLSAYLNILTGTNLAMKFQWNDKLEDRFLNNLKSIIIRLENRRQITAFAKEYLLKKTEILKNL